MPSRENTTNPSSIWTASSTARPHHIVGPDKSLIITMSPIAPKIGPQYLIGIQKSSLLGANTNRSPVCSSTRTRGFSRNAKCNVKTKRPDMTRDKPKLHWCSFQYLSPNNLFVANSEKRDERKTINTTKMPFPLHTIILPLPYFHIPDAERIKQILLPKRIESNR